MRSRPGALHAFGLLCGFALIGVAPIHAEDEDRFPGEVRPILIDTCLACHAADTKKGGLDLTRRAAMLEGGDSGAAIVPGKPEESLLFEKIEAGDMPPRKPLKPEQVAAFKAWIENGANFDTEPLAARRAGPGWWSLQPIRRAEPPSVRNVNWIRTPIDAFILAKLEASGLTPAPEADKLTLIRRATFDLTGLPPKPSEIDEFLNDQSPIAYERLVDRLLASPSYGERWARHWLDVVRFAESHGYEMNQLRPNAWPYRDYVIHAYNVDTPFAQFVAEQLAGDRSDPGAWLKQAATGFLVGGAHDMVGNKSPEGMLQQRADDLDDIITATSTAFLGLTVNCARCHDHKFDPIPQRDYYGLAAVFSGVQYEDRRVPAPDAEQRRSEAKAVAAELAEIDQALDAGEPLFEGASQRAMVEARRNVERFEPTSARFVRFNVRATSNASEPCIDELEIWTDEPTPRNVALGATPEASSTYPNAAIHKLEHINDGRYGNSHSWISAEPGKGWIQLDLGRVERIERIVWGRDHEEKFKDRTPTEYDIEAADGPGQWRVIASSADRTPFAAEAKPSAPADESKERLELKTRGKALSAKLATLSPTTPLFAGTFKPAEPTYILRRGDPTQKLGLAHPSGLSAVKPATTWSEDLDERGRRLALARWIADPENPLSRRVMVNRVWKDHFGQGIVNTPSDFGFNGDPPSHPELLDWLASEFRANGGRIKPLQRLIVLSATYRQSSAANARAAKLDNANRLHWRFEPQRLEAEELRDAMLAVAGKLDRRMTGPGYWIWEPNTNYVVVFKPLADLGPEHFRRMIYQYKARSQADPTFGAFDCPDGGLVAPKRNVSTTALQALNLLNSRFLLAQSEYFATRLKREAGDDPNAQVERAFRLALGRSPNAAEQRGAVELIHKHGPEALARALYNANEFLYAP